jgi:hypothetical protein
MLTPVSRIKVFLYLLVRDINFSIDPDVIIEKRIKCVLIPPRFPTFLRNRSDCIHSFPQRGHPASRQVLARYGQPDAPAPRARIAHRYSNPCIITSHSCFPAQAPRTQYQFAPTHNHLFFALRLRFPCISSHPPLAFLHHLFRAVPAGSIHSICITHITLVSTYYHDRPTVRQFCRHTATDS